MGVLKGTAAEGSHAFIAEMTTKKHVVRGKTSPKKNVLTLYHLSPLQQMHAQHGQSFHEIVFTFLYYSYELCDLNIIYRGM